MIGKLTEKEHISKKNLFSRDEKINNVTSPKDQGDNSSQKNRLKLAKFSFEGERKVF